MTVDEKIKQILREFAVDETSYLVLEHELRELVSLAKEEK